MWVARSAFTQRITPESTSTIWKRLCIEGSRAAPPQWRTCPIHQSLSSVSPVRKSHFTTTVIPGFTSRNSGLSSTGDFAEARWSIDTCQLYYHSSTAVEGRSAPVISLGQSSDISSCSSVGCSRLFSPVYYFTVSIRIADSWSYLSCWLIGNM